MADYTLALGTHDPLAFAAETDEQAFGLAATKIRRNFADELRRSPEEVVTLMCDHRLVTRPSERADEFLRRTAGPDPLGGTGEMQPGDANTPDCNGD